MAVAFGFYPILDKSHVLSRATREVYTGDGLPLTRMLKIEEILTSFRPLLHSGYLGNQRWSIDSRKSIKKGKVGLITEMRKTKPL